MGIKQPNKQTIIFACQICFSPTLDSHVVLSDKDDLFDQFGQGKVGNQDTGSSSSTLSKKVKDIFIKR